MKKQLNLIYLASACLIISTPAYSLNWGSKSDLGNASVEVAFSPDMGATELVVKAISEARKQIRVAAYSFTSKPIAEALANAHRQGIDVMMVVDKSEAKGHYNLADKMAASGVPVRVDYQYAIMHNKFIIIDGNTVELGSFNFTSAAEHRNAENVMVIRNDDAVAKQYLAEWARLWGESEELKPQR